MPPSDQNQTPVNQPVSNVPEYLHLDPIPEPKPPKSKKKLIIVSTVLVLIIVSAVAAVGMWLYRSGEPNRQLYGAIEKMMSVGYFMQKTVTTLNGKDIRVIQTEYDLSNAMQPKSRSLFSITTEQVTATGEYIVFGDEYFFQFSKLPDSVSRQDGITVDTWYKVNKANLKNTPSTIRSLGMENSIPPLGGNIIIGNLNENITGTLIGYINGKEMYAYGNVVKDGEKTKYTISLESRHIGELNIKLAEQLNRATPPAYSALAKNKPYKTTYELTVDNQTGRLVRIAQAADANEKDKSALAATSFTYPDSLSITPPKDFKEIARG